MNTHTNGAQVTFAPRAMINQVVIEDCSSRCKVEDYIQKAIQDGDNMGISYPTPRGKVQRRALIIAPEYEDYPDDKLPTLSATAADIKHIHELLVTFGYERENIRILCDVCAGNGYSYPTRKNILDSLEWLTSDVPADAYRFLHFSGHGVHILSDDKKGKLIRDSDWDPYKEPGTLDTERSSSQIFSGRVKELTVPKTELKYYNEAIATRRDVSDKEQPRDVILDSQLNQALSRLPSDCTITCTLDCCASGRMLNLPTKVAGPGFRGAKSSGISSHTGSVTSLLDSNDEKLDDGAYIDPDLYQRLLVGNREINNRGKPQHGAVTSQLRPQIDTSISPPTAHDDTSGDATQSTGVLGLLNPFNLFSLESPTICLSEELPDSEKRLNNVKARIISWSASHQRQEAWDANTGYVGLFTQARAFTQACLKLRNNTTTPGTFTYEQLYKEASQRVASQRKKSQITRPQFVQLWSSLKDDEQETKIELMKSKVVF